MLLPGRNWYTTWCKLFRLFLRQSVYCFYSVVKEVNHDCSPFSHPFPPDKTTWLAVTRKQFIVNRIKHAETAVWRASAAVWVRTITEDWICVWSETAQIFSRDNRWALKVAVNGWNERIDQTQIYYLCRVLTVWEVWKIKTRWYESGGLLAAFLFWF